MIPNFFFSFGELHNSDHRAVQRVLQRYLEVTCKVKGTKVWLFDEDKFRIGVSTVNYKCDVLSDSPWHTLNASTLL
jgi:hypothetical protein